MLAKIEDLLPTVPSDEPAEPITSDNPIRGALIKKQYTSIAHFILISELLPSDADLHLISDPEGAFVVAAPVGFAGPLKEQRADLTFVTFDKKASNPTKKALVAKYMRQLRQFIDQHGQGQDASAIRRAFIAVHGVSLSKLSYGVPAERWSVPIETMYEPSKKVGIAYQRPAGFPDEREERRLELLDRASLHARGQLLQRAAAARLLLPPSGQIAVIRNLLQRVSAVPA